jgi:class 3 adenylate cyclase
LEEEGGSVLLDISSLQAFKKMPVDVFDGVYVGEVKPEALVLCIDIRNFSNFLCTYDENTVFRLVKDFSSNFLSCVNQFAYNCSYYKLLGDGALVVWDTATEDHIEEALLVFDEFSSFLNEFLFFPFPSLGIGGALVMDKLFKYEISAEASGIKYRDYVGYGINLACRLQTLAKKDQMMLNHKLAASTKVPFIEENIPELHIHLEHLKGLQEKDRISLYRYQRK